MSRGRWFLWRRFLRHDPSEEAATAIDMFRSCLQSPNQSDNQSEADVRAASPSRKTTPRALGIRRFTRPSTPSATGLNKFEGSMLRYYWPCGLRPESMPEFTTVAVSAAEIPGTGWIWCAWRYRRKSRRRTYRPSSGIKPLHTPD